MKFALKFLIVVVTILITSSAYADCGKTLRWVVPVYPPYSFQDENAQAKGMDIELGAAILKRAGCKFTIEFRPWKRCLKEIETGASDFMLAASKNTEREKYAIFSAPYRPERAVAWYRKGDQRVANLSSYKEISKSDLTLGLIDGIWVGNDFNKLQEYPDFSARIVRIHDAGTLDHHILTLLIHNRFDIAVTDVVSGYDWAKRLGIADKIAVHPVPIHDDPVHFMISRKTISAKVVRQINDAIIAFLKSPDHDRIREKYLPDTRP